MKVKIMQQETKKQVKVYNFGFHLPEFFHFVLPNFQYLLWSSDNQCFQNSEINHL